jgi:hypothetical protein
MHKELKFKNVTWGTFFYQGHKEDLFFGNFTWMLILKDVSNANLFYVFYK